MKMVMRLRISIGPEIYVPEAQDHYQNDCRNQPELKAIATGALHPRPSPRFLYRSGRPVAINRESTRQSTPPPVQICPLSTHTDIRPARARNDIIAGRTGRHNDSRCP